MSTNKKYGHKNKLRTNDTVSEETGTENYAQLFSLTNQKLYTNNEVNFVDFTKNSNNAIKRTPDGKTIILPQKGVYLVDTILTFGPIDSNFYYKFELFDTNMSSVIGTPHIFEYYTRDDNFKIEKITTSTSVILATTYYDKYIQIINRSTAPINVYNATMTITQIAKKNCDNMFNC